uniref:Uncharacterized protein n=1 Tax=Haptolina brevifila TaxID=156173 RepID=A0A7S2GLU0_9EUKA
MGLFSRAKSPAKPAPGEGQLLLQAPPAQELPPPPGFGPSGSSSSQASSSHTADPEATTAAPIVAPVESKPATANGGESKPGDGRASSSNNTTPNSSSRGGFFKKSPKGSARKETSPPPIKEESAGAKPEAKSEAASKAEQPSAGAETQPSGPTPAKSSLKGKKGWASIKAEVTPAEKKRRNSRGLGYGMGFKKPDQWAPIDWQGAATDRSHGTRGRPTSSEGARKGLKEQSSYKETSEDQSKHGPFPAVPNLELHSEPQPPADPTQLPNFSGRWKCTSVEGHWDAYLKMLKVDETRRAIARGTGYGTGRCVQVIRMVGTTEMTITNHQLKRFRKPPSLGFVTHSDSEPVAGVLVSNGVAVNGVTTAAAKENGAVLSPTPEVSKANEAEANSAKASEPPLPPPVPVRMRIDGSEQQITVENGQTFNCTVNWESRALCVRFTIGYQRSPVLMQRFLKPDGDSMVVRVMVDDFFAQCTYQMVDDDGDVLPPTFRMPVLAVGDEPAR